nr:hypothetical protein [Tanacetum cinerariifolium]
ANGARLLWGSSGEGSGDVMEVVESPGMEESGDVESWRENRVQVLQCRYLNVGGTSTVGTLGTCHS